ncbi:MFS transporter [Actinoplanes ianthinogenes]|nr:MFS transporter [Actinoplanes ianthinogenes]
MRRAPALSFLLVTVFLDIVGLGLIVPITPALLTAVTADPSQAVLWSGLLGTAFGLLQFAAAPLLGRLSDRYGRRPVLLLSLGCLGVDWLAHAIAGSPGTLLVFHAIAGACAGTNTVVNAYIADVTPPERRARAYGLVGAAFGLGFVAGPTIGGLLGAVDVRLPFLAAAALSFANLAYGALILPESRPGDRTTPLTLRATNPVSAITAILRRPVLGRLAQARLCADLARMIHQATWAFFLTYRFGWDTTHVGLVIAAVALAGALFQARAVGPVVRRLGEKRTAVGGGLLSVTTFFGTAFASTPGQLYPLLTVGVLASAGGAAAQSWISGTAGADEQGTVQGGLSAIGAVAEAVVPLAAGVAFGALVAYGKPGLIFVVAATLAAASTVLLALTPAGESVRTTV